MMRSLRSLIIRKRLLFSVDFNLIFGNILIHSHLIVISIAIITLQRCCWVFLFWANCWCYQAIIGISSLKFSWSTFICFSTVHLLHFNCIRFAQQHNNNTIAVQLMKFASLIIIDGLIELCTKQVNIVPIQRINVNFFSIKHICVLFRNDECS